MKDSPLFAEFVAEAEEMARRLDKMAEPNDLVRISVFANVGSGVAQIATVGPIRLGSKRSLANVVSGMNSVMAEVVKVIPHAHMQLEVVPDDQL